MNTIIGADAAKLAGLQIDLLTKMRNGAITLEDLEQFVRGELIIGELVIDEPPVSEVTLDWPKVYDFLGLFAQFDQAFPEFPEVSGQFILPEFSGQWPVLVVEDVTRNNVFSVLKTELQKVGKDAYSPYDNLDTQVPWNARDPNLGSYAITVPATIEPNQEIRNLSYQEPRKCVKEETTLLEELLLTLAYFLTTGNHLSIKKIARCGSSRNSDGNVPRVDFDPDYCEVCVGYWRPGYADPLLRARSVGSLS